MSKIVERWLLFKYINGEFTPLSKPLKKKEQAEKPRLKYPERERKTIGVGLIRTTDQLGVPPSDTETVLGSEIGLTMLLRWGANNPPLRDELDKIIEDFADSDEHLGEQVGLIMRLASKYDASISLVRETKPGEPSFTCYQHSFGLVGVESVNRILDENCHITLGRDFIQRLVDKWLGEVSIEDAKDGDHVLYIGSRIEHAGKVAQDAVESKWGKAHLWRHGVFEVPRRYGDTVRFFRHISKEESIQAFHGYASIHGAVMENREHGPKQPLLPDEAAAINLSFEQTLVEVGRQTLVEDSKVVELDSRRYTARQTPKRGLRQVDFVLDGNEIRGLEQNPDTKSRWAQLARSGEKVMQFLSEGRYVANEVDGKATLYGGRAGTNR